VSVQLAPPPLQKWKVDELVKTIKNMTQKQELKIYFSIKIKGRWDTGDRTWRTALWTNDPRVPKKHLVCEALKVLDF